MSEADGKQQVNVQQQVQVQGQVQQGQGQVQEQVQQGQGQVQEQVQAPGQDPAPVVFNIELEEKKMLLDRDYINKATQMASTNKFTGEHYLLWRELIGGILVTAELSVLFDADARRRMAYTYSPKYIYTKQANAKMIILSGLSKEIASQYSTMADPANILVTLDSVYNSNTSTTRSEIRKKFQQLQLDDFKTVSEYIETLKYTVQKMISMDVVVSDEEKIHQLFTGLPEEFGPTISYLRIANIKNFDTIVSTIRDCGVEWEKKQKQNANNDQVHYVGNNKIGGNYNNRHYNKNNNNNITITAYTDADWGGDYVDRKSTTGYLIKINGCTISWTTKKQKTVALSTAEAEYMGIAAGVQEVIWLKQIISEMVLIQNKQMNTIPILYCDNQAAVSISHNDIHHHRTKHIDIRHHFIRDHVKQNNIQLKWIPTQDQLADGLTKPLDKIKFKKLTHEMMNNISTNTQQQQQQQ